MRPTRELRRPLPLSGLEDPASIPASAVFWPGREGDGSSAVVSGSRKGERGFLWRGNAIAAGVVHEENPEEQEFGLVMMLLVSSESAVRHGG